MELLVLEPCRYTRLGISLFIQNEKNINVNYVSTLDALIAGGMEKNPDIIFANLTPYCKHDPLNLPPQAFFRYPQRATCFIYTQAHYPYTQPPLYLQRNIYLINKKMTPTLLRLLCCHAPRQTPPAHLLEQRYGAWPLLTTREIMVMHDWMQQTPNHRIAQRLRLSPRTVYAYKRRLVEKIRVKNRIELCYLYNLIRHIY
ncbi:LuxR C-terminal-related transcriptional regulator [Edwardsiella piscicida]|uniref:helix-turn-helix transcriptional regulator n=1 Tax=Edwardsiella piscicida TaxID=1263550 RepID=UPI001CEDD502|nr:LuxR C-terminal-related transcriptional regulator [Edwardsiella piscicida]AOP43320.2 LuxR C-terminal-related transcriptional regulator [Edwardsiella piscicida]